MDLTKLIFKKNSLDWHWLVSLNVLMMLIVTTMDVKIVRVAVKDCVRIIVLQNAMERAKGIVKVIALNSVMAVLGIN